jgi:hypothetical protein
MSTTTQKAEIVERVTIKTQGDATEYSRVISGVKKSKDKIIRDIEITDITELVVRNVAELVAVRAIRDKKNREKISKTQSIINKFKSLV